MVKQKEAKIVWNISSPQMANSAKIKKWLPSQKSRTLPGNPKTKPRV